MVTRLQEHPYRGTLSNSCNVPLARSHLRNGCTWPTQMWFPPHDHGRLLHDIIVTLALLAVPICVTFSKQYEDFCTDIFWWVVVLFALLCLLYLNLIESNVGLIFFRMNCKFFFLSNLWMIILCWTSFGVRDLSTSDNINLQNRLIIIKKIEAITFVNAYRGSTHHFLCNLVFSLRFVRLI